MNDTADKYANFSHGELVAEINRLKKHKKYGLVWEHKTEKVIEDFETQQPYLEEVTDKRIEDAPGEPTNLIIEGDNFEALSILNYTHAGKVDVIYIDPPYNTGNKDFIYNDNYVDSEDEFRHSKWLSFMEPRLKLAKNLLKDDGVIFISIDDNEQAALKFLCDDIFGINNFVGEVVNKTPNQTADINKKQIHEYLFIYSKCNDNRKVISGKKIKQEARCTTGKIDQTQPEIEFCAGLEVRGVKDGIYEAPKETGGNEDISLIKGILEVKDGKLKNDVVLKARWSNPNDLRQYMRKMKSGSSDRIFNKFGKELTGLYLKGARFQPIMEKIGFDDLNSIIEISGKGSIDLKNLGMSELFSYPKSVNYIKYLISLCLEDAIVIDFFAGSGTTGQAVLELNKQDGGHRQFILCTNNGDKSPDSTKIAEEITYPRIKTVITGVRQDGSKYSDGIPANLRYYKINHREKKPSIDANRQDIVTYMENIIQVKENAYKQLEVNEDFAIYESSEKYVGLVFEPFSLEEVIANLKERNEEKRPVKLYVFSYSRDAFEDDYGTDFEIEFVAMPEGLLKTYAHIVEEQKKEDL